LGKKNGKEAVGRGVDWGFSSPHTLLPKEEKEEKNAFCGVDTARRVPLKGMALIFIRRCSPLKKNPFKIKMLY
jgi:hypothetical protein